MEKTLEKILDECLTRLQKGQTIEDCLNAYPEYKKELKDLLQLALSLKSAPHPEPSQEAISLTLIKMGEALSKEKVKGKLAKIFYWPKLNFAKALVYALVIVLVFWSADTLSASSMPGTFLYPVKIASEKLKFFLSFRHDDKANLRLIFARRRTEELLKELEKRGYLRQTVLSAMLTQTKYALNNIYYLPPQKQRYYLMRLANFYGSQKEILEDLKPKVKADQRKILENIIQTCERRVIEMRRMMREGMPYPKAIKMKRMMRHRMLSH
jgi:hypothetical protein